MEGHQVGDPTILFTIGNLSFSAYGLMLLIAGFLVAVVSYIEWRKKGYHWFHFFVLFEFIAFFSLFGARWWYLAFNPGDFTSLLSLFSIGYGRSIMGAIFFTVLVIYVYIKVFAKELEYRRVISIVLPNLLLGQAIGRWGNFFDHNIYGPIAENELVFLPEFIRQGMYITDEFGNTYYRQPLFLYESMLDLLGWVVILFILKPNKEIKPGVHAGVFFMYYGLVRAILEPFRCDPNSMMHIGKVPTSFVFAILFFIIGIVMIVYYQWYFIDFNYEYGTKFSPYFKYKMLLLKLNLFKFIKSEKEFHLEKKQLSNFYYLSVKERQREFLEEIPYLRRSY